MKLILIDGGPASGKNTLGELIVKKIRKSVLLDLDNYVEQLCPSWIWKDEKQKLKDLSKVRQNFIKDINKYIDQNQTVIVIGERFMTKKNIYDYINKLKKTCTVLVFHLSVPFSLREHRLNQRGPHTLIDLVKDQKDRDEIKSWPGCVYQNINTPEIDAINLTKLIRENTGKI
jgi:shikimate kinase